MKAAIIIAVVLLVCWPAVGVPLVVFGALSWGLDWLINTPPSHRY